MAITGTASRRSKSAAASGSKTYTIPRPRSIANTFGAAQSRPSLIKRPKSIGPPPLRAAVGTAPRPPPKTDEREEKRAPMCGRPYYEWVSQIDFKKHRPKGNEAPTVGFQNNGNMCFLNAVLQSLLHTPLLRHLLLRNCGKPQEEWLAEVAGLYRQVDAARPNRMPVSAAKLAGMLFLASTTDEFRRGAQADAHEAFMLIITKLLEGCLQMTGIVESAISFAEKERLERSSLVGHVFGMDVASKVCCNACSYESTTTRVEYCLCISCTLGMSDSQLEILQKEVTPHKKNRFHMQRVKSGPEIEVPSTSLEALLREFTKGETIAEFKCEKCCQKGCTRTASVAKPPNVLIVHVYRRQGDGVFSKINRYVKFNERLDLAAYMTDSRNPSVYQLYAVIVHSEVNKTLGHYVAYIRDRNNGWYCLDDNRVEAVSWSHVQAQDAYMLLYESERVLPPNVELSDEASTSAGNSTAGSLSSGSANGARLEEVRQQAADHVKKKEFENAAKLWTEAIELRPKDTDLLLNRAFSLRQLRRWEDAEADAAQALQLDANNLKAFYAQTLALYRMGKLAKALERCSAGLSVDKTDKQLTHLKDVIVQAQKLSELKKRASEQLQAQDFESSLEAYTEALTLQPKDFTSLSGRANVYLELGQWEEAKHDAERALELNSKSCKVLLTRAVALRKLGDFTECREACRAGLVQQPDDTALKEELALVQKEMEAFDAKQRGQQHLDNCEYDDALVAFGQAIALRREEDPCARLGRARAHAARGEWEAAESDAAQALAVAPVCRQPQSPTASSSVSSPVHSQSFKPPPNTPFLDWRADAHHVKAMALHHRGQFLAALEECEAGLGEVPQHAALLQLRFNLIEEVSKESPPASPNPSRRSPPRKALIVSL